MGQATIDNHKPAKSINKGEIADELKKLDEFIERREIMTVRVKGK